jgi:hypothetical protein
MLSGFSVTFQHTQVCSHVGLELEMRVCRCQEHILEYEVGIS